MIVSRFFSTVRAVFGRGAAWAARRPAAAAGLALVLPFFVALKTSVYDTFYYDALGYWHLSGDYWASGSFRFTSFSNILRGYFFPLVLAPLAWLNTHYDYPPIALVRGLGLATAVGLFAVVAPALWRAVQEPPAPAVPWGRRLVFGLVGLVVWGGYFNFPLTDFPALLALLTGLYLLVATRGAGGGLLAGMAVAAAVNCRPVYLAALPVAALLCLWPQPALAAAAGQRWRGAARRLAFGLGVGAVLYPQYVVNLTHYHVRSPLVLAVMPGDKSLFLWQLEVGLEVQKYETNVGDDYPEATVFFRDAASTRWATAAGLLPLTSYGQYAQAIARHPVGWLGLLGRRLFNGLDVQYSTPYLKAVYTGTWPLALLNYTALLGGLGVLVLGGRRRGPHPRRLLVLAAVLAPCAAVLPGAMECRFLLPLHLLLVAAGAFGTPPLRHWRRLAGRWAVVGALAYTGALAGCFALSANTQRQLKWKPRRVFDWPTPAPAPAPEPW